MERVLSFNALVRGFIYRLLFGIKVGRSFRIGKDCVLSRRLLRAGDRVHIGAFSQVSGRIELGDDVYVHRHVILRAFDGFISIAPGTTVNPYTRIYGKGGVTIGSMVSIAPGVTIVAANKNTADLTVPIKRQGVTTRGITIQDDVWIGANATILDGVTLGEGCVVGAGAVVTKDVPPRAVVGGVPAVVIGQRGTAEFETGHTED